MRTHFEVFQRFRKSLASGKVYIRRPGGYSEEARNQDDWEKLIERLVKARQGDMLDSIREILNPSSEILVKDEGLDSWHSENMKLWQQEINEFPEDDPRRLKMDSGLSPFLSIRFKQKD